MNVGKNFLMIELCDRNIHFLKHLDKNTSITDEKIPKFKDNGTTIGIDKLPNKRWEDGAIRMGSGLSNPGTNICYMNVVLQVITHTPFLASALVRSGHTNVCPNFKKKVFCTMCLLEKHIKETTSKKKVLSNPLFPIVKKVIWHKFQYGQQDDAFIFLKHFLDSLIKGCYGMKYSNDLNGSEGNETRNGGLNRNKSSKPPLLQPQNEIMESVIGRIFGGYLRNVIICQTCNCKSEKLESFFDIPIDVSTSNRLIELLSNFVMPENLTGSNKYFCSFCKSYQDANKSLSIYKSPMILSINLKRFNFNVNCYDKSHKAIDFPVTMALSLKPNSDDEIWIKYDLYAIVCHLGKSIHMGHYVTFIKGPHGFWYRFDDSNVSSVAESNVLARKNDAYLLFYSIRDVDAENCNTIKNNGSYTNAFKVIEGDRKEEDADLEAECEGTDDAVTGDNETCLHFFNSEGIINRLVQYKKYPFHKLYINKVLCKFHRRLKKTNEHTHPISLPTPPELLRIENQKSAPRENSGSLVDGSREMLSGQGLQHTPGSKLSSDSFSNYKSQFNAENLEAWSDCEEIANYESVQKSIDPPANVRTEEDIEYDRGRLKKVKKREESLDDAEVLKHKSGAYIAVHQKDQFDKVNMRK